MSLRRAVVNLGSYNVSQVLSSGVQFVWGVYLANSVGPGEYGRYVVVVAFVALFAACLDFGMELVVVRDVARRRELASRYLGGLAVWRALLTGVVGFVVFVAARLVGFPDDIRVLIAVFYASAAMHSLAAVGTTIVQAFERFALIGIVGLGQGLASAALGFVILKAGYGLLGVFWAYVIVGSLTLLVVAVITWKLVVRIEIRPDRELLAYMVKEAAPLGTVAIFSTVYSRVDRVILTKMASAVAVGWYNAGFVLVQGIMDLMWSTFNRVTYPILSRIKSDDDVALARVTEVLILVFAGVFSFVSVVVSFLSRDLIGILYARGGFEEAGEALGILIWLTVPTILWAIYRNVLLVKGRQGMYAAITGAGMVVNILLVFLCVGVWGWIGAAYASIATQVFLLAITYAYVRQTVGPMLPLRGIAKVMALSGVAAIAMWLSHRSGNGLAALPMLGFAYFVSLFVVGAVKVSDWAAVKRVL